MIRVTVELVSSRGKEHDRLLGVAKIANVGGTTERANYKVWFSKWAPKHGEAWKTGIVEGFPRLKRGPWDLLYLALRAVVAGRNK